MGVCMVRYALLLLLLLLQGTSAQTQETMTGLAVLDLQAIGIAESEAKALSDMLRSNVTKVVNDSTIALKDKYSLIERSQMDKIFDEFNVQNTGCTDLSCAVDFGKMLSADRIIIGSVSLVGSTYIVIARIVDVKTGKALVSVDRKQSGVIDNVIDLMPYVALELLTGEHREAPATPSSPQVSSNNAAPPDAVIISSDAYLWVSSQPYGTAVFLDGKQIGVTPLEKVVVPKGRHRLKLTYLGYEDYTTYVKMHENTPVVVTRNLVPLLKDTAFAKSFLFPGMGQAYLGHNVKGAVFAVIHLGMIAAALDKLPDLMPQIKEYHDAKDKYHDASYNFANLYDDMKEKEDTLRKTQRTLWYYTGVMGVSYFINLVDIVATDIPGAKGTVIGKMNIEPVIGGSYTGVVMNVRF